MKYLPLFNLLLQHDYYSNKKCNDFIIEPTPKTQTLLGNHRCVLKLFSSGAQVLIQTTDQNTPTVSLPVSTEFTFRLRLRNTDFFLFTDTVANTTLTPNSDAGKAVISTNDPSLTFNQLVTMAIDEQDVFGYASVMTDSNPTSLIDNPKELHIEFKAKKYRWKYYVVVNTASSIPSIEDRENKIVFNQAVVITANNANGGPDTIGKQLIEQHPGLTVFCLLSADLIPSQEASRKTLLLKINGTKEIDYLPSPSIHNYMLDGNDSVKDNLYCKVNHFTQQP